MKKYERKLSLKEQDELDPREFYDYMLGNTQRDVSNLLKKLKMLEKKYMKDYKISKNDMYDMIDQISSHINDLDPEDMNFIDTYFFTY